MQQMRGGQWLPWPAHATASWFAGPLVRHRNGVQRRIIAGFGTEIDAQDVDAGLGGGSLRIAAVPGEELPPSCHMVSWVSPEWMVAVSASGKS